MRNLLIKYLAGIITLHERQRIAEWLKFSENRKKYKNLESIWILMESYKSGFNPDITKAWQKFDTRIQKARKRKIYLISLPSIAASFLIFFSVWSIFRNSTDKLITIYSESTMIKEIVLPDSSNIYLKKGSFITYSPEFEKRYVKLNGEAYFEIRKMKNSDFIVDGIKTQIKVLGTSFNYLSDSIYFHEEIKVFTGKVQFTNKSDNNRTILKKGTKSKLADNKLESSDFNPNYREFYKTGEISFRDTPLKEFASIMMEYYGQKIIIEDITIQNIVINSSFKNASVEEIIEEITLITNLNVKREKENLVITK